MVSNLSLNYTDGELLAEHSQYRRLLGRLMYLTISRSDLTFGVNKLSQYMSQPRVPHLQALHHVLQYLKATPGQGLFFPVASSFKVTAYADADWGSCKDTRKSTTGYCIFLGSALIAWKSKKQPTVARSSAEAEYRALACLTSELLWLKQLLRTFHVQFNTFMVLSDSKSAIQLATNPSNTGRTKHVDIDCHFIRQHIASKFLSLIHVSSKQQLADVFTKALPRLLLHELIPMLGILNIYLPT